MNRKEELLERAKDLMEDGTGEVNEINRLIIALNGMENLPDTPPYPIMGGDILKDFKEKQQALINETKVSLYLALRDTFDEIHRGLGNILSDYHSQ